MTNDTEYWKRQANRLYDRVLADVRIIAQNRRYIVDHITLLKAKNMHPRSVIRHIYGILKLREALSKSAIAWTGSTSHTIWLRTWKMSSCFLLLRSGIFRLHGIYSISNSFITALTERNKIRHLVTSASAKRYYMMHM